MIVVVPLIRDPLMSQGFAPTLTQGKNRPKTLEAQALSQRPDCFHG